MNRSLFYLVFVVLFSFSVFASGLWIQVPPPSISTCSGYAYVMCSENDSNYNYINHLIPYHENNSVTEKFCGIHDISNGRKLEFIDASSLSDLKSKTSSEICGPSAYDGFSEYWDENCNGDELFGKTNSGSLDLTSYIENGNTFEVEFDDSNIDNFDIVSGCGGKVRGKVTDCKTGEAITDVNISFRFYNSLGEEYFSLNSDISGNFDSSMFLRDIQTNFKNYRNIDAIPKTKYLVVATHTNYLTNSLDLVLDEDIETLNFCLDPVENCNDDCTFVDGDVCKEVCDGINGCSFGTFPDGYSTKFLLDGLLANLHQTLSYNGDSYTGYACEGNFVKSTRSNYNSVTCDNGKSMWTSTRIVDYNGQRVRMIVTYCE